MEGMEIARQRIAEEAEAQTGILNLGRLGLTFLPDELFELVHLRQLNLGSDVGFEGEEYVGAASGMAPNLIHQDLDRLAELSVLRILSLCGMSITDLSPIHSLYKLEALDCAETQVDDLTQLVGLTNLQWLNLSETQVDDLTSLSGLTNLQTLNCIWTQVNDLTPLSDLTNLRNLYFISALVKDLTPLARVTNLQTLDLSETRVNDLTPLASLTTLKNLSFSATSVDDLTPLSGLKNLLSLNCSQTQVNNLTPLSGLKNLKSLNCSNTQLNDLTPLSGLTNLETLNCICTQANDLTPLLDLTNLRSLDISINIIAPVDSGFWTRQALINVKAYKTELQGFPEEVLSRYYGDNCLPAIRAHLNDLGDDPVPLNQVKLMVLGNGRIGKTQIINRLSNRPYDNDADSTHGVTLTQAPIPSGDGTFAIWDFGGQDIYHGTHALFLKSRAVFLLVWTAESDNASENEHSGMRFRNQPLSWWLDYVRRFGSERSPLVVVQNQLDKNHDRGDHPSVAKLRESLTFCRSLAYSAATNEGREVLDAYLKIAAKRFNPPLIGKGRLQVMEHLIALRESDATLPVDSRIHRTMTLADFATICVEAGNVSDKRQLLEFLHNAGVAFWREGLFEDLIILDQEWVLNAIYTVFNRDKCLQQLHNNAGRFTRSALGLMIWDEQGYSQEEQKLFLSFMLSCGICFKIDSGNTETEDTYIAPDMLPESWAQDERSERWGDEPAEHERRFNYESLPPALMRNLICRIGERAGFRCHYWRNGFYGYEVHTRSRVLLEQEIQENWRGEICIQTRGGRAQQLLDWIIKALSEEEKRLGLSGTELSKEHSKPMTETPEMRFEEAPNQARTFYVSYAWADRNQAPEDSREHIVDEFCAAAEKRNIKIHRDKNDMDIGNRTSTFMSRLSRADRVIVVLSDKYLKSPFCMTELYEIWMQSRGEGDRFLKRVRVYTQDDALIWTVVNRASYAIHWKNEFETINTMIKEHDINVLGDQDKISFGLMAKFYIHIGDMQNTLADVLQPRSLDDLVNYSFDDDDFDDT